MATVTSFPITTVPLSPLVGIKVNYSTTTTDSDPGAGTFRFNNATVASATAAYIDNTDNGGRTITGLLDLMDDSTGTVKGRLRFENVNDQTIWAEFQITGSVVDGTGYRKLTLQNGVSAGTFADADEFAIAFYANGDTGAVGMAFKYTWSTSTSGDPGTGKIAVNNASPGSATGLQISETDADGNGLASEIARWDDPTNASGKARLKIAKNATNFLLLTITSAVTDNGTWDSFTVSSAVLVGSLTNGDSVYVQPSVSGADGAGISGGLSAGKIAGRGASSGTGDLEAITPDAGSMSMSGTTLRAYNTLPTRQVFTSGSGTYNRPANVTWIEVEIVGGGGGGGGSGASAGSGGAGGNTTFSTLTANGGAAGAPSTAAGGLGGTASGGDLNINGGRGEGGSGSANVRAGNGGHSKFFGGTPAPAVGGNPGVAAPSNSGAGGSGGSSSDAQQGGGGGGGGWAKKIITSPSATYSYAVGAGGTAGAAGSAGSAQAGGAGGSGIVIVTEHYGS